MPAKDSEELQGVRGWLLLLCIHIVIINPIAYVFVLGINSDHFIGANGFSWDLFLNRRFPGMAAFRIVSIFSDIVILTFGIVAGIRLWRLKPRSVEMVNTYFLVAVIVALFTLGLPWLAGVPERVSDNLFTHLLISFVRVTLIAAIWLTYLSKSKRVQAMYFP